MGKLIILGLPSMNFSKEFSLVFKERGPAKRRSVETP